MKGKGICLLCCCVAQAGRVSCCRSLLKHYLWELSPFKKWGEFSRGLGWERLLEGGGGGGVLGIKPWFGMSRITILWRVCLSIHFVNKTRFCPDLSNVI